MTNCARSALRRRCIINQIMLRPEPFASRLARAATLFPTHVKVWEH